MIYSHIQPFESGRNKGLGGMAQRATIIKRLEMKEIMYYY